MDFVYFCRPGNNEELRYSIRSLYASYANPKVWVVGDKPDWYVGNYLHVPQTKTKFNNVLDSLRAVLDCKEISQYFVLMNDDFFMLQPAKSIRSYHGGRLIDKIDKYDDLMPSSSYVKMLKSTYDRLVKMGVSDPLDYELHVPMLMNKRKLSRCLTPGILWRSMYGNLNSVGGKRMKDVKVYVSGPFKNNLSYNLSDYEQFLSTDDSSFAIFRDQLNARYPHPSINESKSI